MQIYNYKKRRFFGSIWVLFIAPVFLYTITNDFFQMPDTLKWLTSLVAVFIFLTAVRAILLMTKEIALTDTSIELRKFFVRDLLIDFSNISAIEYEYDRDYLSGAILMIHNAKKEYINLDYLKDKEVFIEELEKSWK